MSKIFWFFGLPGSGKGTQAKFITERIKNRGVSTSLLAIGESIREILYEGENKEFNNKFITAMENGLIIPSNFPLGIVLKHFEKNFNTNTTFVIDGLGRKLVEAKIALEFFDMLDIKDINVIYINISEKESIRRLTKRGREDDNVESVKNRIAEYQNKEYGTKLSVDYLRNFEGVNFIEIDGTGTREEVFDRIKGYGDK